MKYQPPANVSAGPGDILQNSHDAAAVLGGVSSMTMWRYVKVGVLPEPIKLRGRNHWWRSVIAKVAEGDGSNGTAPVRMADLDGGRAA